MSAELPLSPTQVSADGKFYWDGQQWVPMLAQAPERVATQQPRRGNSCMGYGCGTVGNVADTTAVELDQPALNQRFRRAVTRRAS